MTSERGHTAKTSLIVTILTCLNDWREGSRSEIVLIVVVRRLAVIHLGIWSGTTSVNPRRLATIVAKIHHHSSGNWQAVIRNNVFEKRCVEGEFEGTRSHRGNLTEQNIFSHSSTVIGFSSGSRLHKDLDRLLERATHESARVRSIDTVASDRHERSAIGHDIGEH